MSGEAFGIRVADSACPDCDADTTTVEVSPNLFVVEVRHDDTCPTWAQHQNRNRRKNRR